ncbi:thiamine phosphate synthase [Eubacteriaceae bacterium ES2]|nr:thiamine phosphate synthase [Eubacteriaceae bacterium ES2]
MLFYVSNQKLCKGDFLARISQLAAGKPDAIILREKDLSRADFYELAIQIKEICAKNQVKLIINQDIDTAAKVSGNVQLSMDHFMNFQGDFKSFKSLGVSVHSVEEAKKAQKKGASYLIAGHIFATDCKKGLSPRGLDFLAAVCQAVAIPVFAIGGINDKRYPLVLKAGAAGACIMSETMVCQDPQSLADRYRKNL